MAIRLQWGLTDEFQLRAAMLIYDTFVKKFQYTLGPRKKGIHFIAHSFKPEFGLMALRNGDFVGIASAKTTKGELVQFQFGLWIRTYHIKAVQRFLITFPFWYERHGPDELLLSSLCIVESAQGQGIGTLMIQEFIQYGTNQGYRVLKLNVINSNLRARALYEKLGFKITKYSKIPFPWSHLLGFTGVYEMSYSLI